MKYQAEQTPLDHADGSKYAGQFLPSATSISRDEMNLAEFPLAVLSTRTNPTVKTLEFSDVVRLSSGETIERQWIVTGADKFGLPTSTDDDVILGLIRLTKEQSFRERKVFFTRYELLKILRWTTEGRSYSRLTKSLDRLSGLRIRASNAFYDNTLKAYQTKNFGIIDAYEINDERGGTCNKNPNSYFIWSELMFDSFKSGFIKKIDLDFYFSLKSAVSRRLYRYLDKHFYYSRIVEKPLMVFAFEKLGLSRTYRYVSSVKQQIMPACEELVAKGFLANIEFCGKGEGTVVKFIKAGTEAPVIGDSYQVSNKTMGPLSQKTAITRAISSASAATTSTDQIGTLLTERGLTVRQAKYLLANKDQASLEKIKKIVVYYDHLLETGNAKISKNPIGFLYRAVEKPTEFKIPTSDSADTKSFNLSAARQKRPELKLVAQNKKGQEQTAKLKQNYEDFTEQAYSKIVDHFPPEELLAVSRRVEQKIACLKQVLDADKYDRALRGMVKTELLNLANIPSFEEWSAKHTNC